MQTAIYIIHPPVSSSGRILGRNQDKNLFLLAIQSLALRFFFFKLMQPLTFSTVQLLYTVKEKGGKPFISFIWQSRPKRQYFTTFFNTTTWIKHNFIRKIQIDQENLIENHTSFPMVQEIHTETSVMRTLKITPRNRSKILRSLIRLLQRFLGHMYCKMQMALSSEIAPTPLPLSEKNVRIVHLPNLFLTISTLCEEGRIERRPQVKYGITVDLQSLFGLHVHVHWLRPPTPLPHWSSYTVGGRYWSAKIDDISL